MICPKCQFENREEAIFCRKCGASLEIYIACPNCEASNPPDSRFCEKCGQDLKPPKEALSIDYSRPHSYTPKFLADKIRTTRSSIEGEPKLVTVLFADVANYTAMSEKFDPEEVHQIMDGCFNILMDEIHRFEGTINQFTGDGVMALFGAPLAHEDHAQRACHAALSIQKTLGNYSEKIKHDHVLDFNMRIGLNSGPVIVASIGDDLRMDYTAVGDTTNLAARMESKAEPGKILVSGATHKLVKDFFEFNPLGKVEVKGKEQPQEAYELIKAGEIETRINASVAKGLSKFVGRKNSMPALRKPFEHMLTGSGQVVGIVGEAGVGKSRLLLEFINQLPQGEYTYLEGRCLHYGGGMAYLPIIDLVRSFFEIKEGDQELAIKNKLKEKIGQLDQRLSGSLPPFQELLSLKVHDERYLQLDPGQKKTRIFEAIRDLFLRHSEQKPLVLAIEDLHWIDKTSEECISYLIDWLPNKRIFLILLYRLDYTHQWGNKSYYTKIGLAPLTTVSSGKLVQTILGDAEVVTELRELILSRAGGNPLFVEEFTHSLLENGLIQKRDHQYVLGGKTSEIEVPYTVQGIIAARIDRIEKNLKHVVQVASVIGREFALRILHTVMGMREELKSHLLDLQGMEFITEKRLFPELEYIFKHALTQEVAYNSLLQKRRKEIHEQIGEAIETLYPERIEEFYELSAYHYKCSDNKDKALKYLHLANQKAIKLNALEEAKAYFEEAMQILCTLPETEHNQHFSISLIVNQWLVYGLLFMLPEYYKLMLQYKPIVVKLGNEKLSGIFLTKLGFCESWIGNLDQGIQTLTDATKLCEASENAEEAGLAYMFLLQSYLFKSNSDQVFQTKKRFLRVMQQRFEPASYVRVFAYTSLCYVYLGDWPRAIEEGHEALRVAEEYLDDRLISLASSVISSVYTHKGELDRSFEYGEIAVKKAPTLANELWAKATLAWAFCKSDEIQQGVEILAEVVPIFRIGGQVMWEIYGGTMLGDGYILAGNYEKAKQTLESCLELAESCGMKHFIGWIHRLLGEVAIKTYHGEAFPHFKKSIDVLREIKANNELALAYAGLGRLYKQQEDKNHARIYLKKALVIFEQLGTLLEADKIREDLVGLHET